jgi:hypothetical protein
MVTPAESAAERMRLLNAARDAGYLASLALADTGESDTAAGRALLDAICALDEAVRQYGARHKEKMRAAFAEFLKTNP